MEEEGGVSNEKSLEDRKEGVGERVREKDLAMTFWHGR